ncbi:hypothetical protein DRP43_01215 [candidate division TA06 bacterium]|uniref:Nudix hydrolase domain-containing protein n=1 Tax=candidate division TA06 bacterium TaxID=2250710 RepID=A0A660SQ99_UNCT6|nr:MAG: hypothetical protein DRP43_01215 [candidate division TA06 bacterium]
MTKHKYCPICRTKLKIKVFNNKERLTCPKCNYIYYKNPPPSVCAIVVNRGNILLIKRGIEPHLGKWAFPCGFIEYGETAEDACLRELKEETGLSGTIKSLYNVKSAEIDIYGHLIIIAYIVLVDDKKPIGGDDAIDAKYFSIDEAKQIIIPEQRNCLDDEKIAYE